jgi:DNA-binding GntR family transcriptional regulator
VQLFRNRGAIVSPISVETIEDKLAVLGALEGFAAKIVCETASDEQLKELSGIHRRFVKEFDGGDPELYFDLNQTFHRKLVEMAGNSALVDLHALLAKHVRRPRVEGVRQHVPTRSALDDHRTLMKALLARDGQAAQHAAEDHLNRVAVAVVKHFRAR